jgi:hypothetical protein
MARRTQIAGPGKCWTGYAQQRGEVRLKPQPTAVHARVKP